MLAPCSAECLVYLRALRRRAGDLNFRCQHRSFLLAEVWRLKPTTQARKHDGPSLVSNRHSASILPEAQPNPAPAPAPAQPGWHLAEFIRTCSHDNTSLSGVPLPNIASFQTLCTLFGAPASCADRTRVEGACCLETLSQSWVCRLTAVQPFAHNHEYLCETTCLPMFLPIVITLSKLNHQPWLPSFRETM